MVDAFKTITTLYGVLCMQKFEKARFNWKLSFICRKEFFHIISIRFKIFSSIIYRLCYISQLKALQFQEYGWNVMRQSITVTKTEMSSSQFVQLWNVPCILFHSFYLLFILFKKKIVCFFLFFFFIASIWMGNCVVKKWFAFGVRTQRQTKWFQFVVFCTRLCDLKWGKKKMSKLRDFLFVCFGEVEFNVC